MTFTEQPSGSPDLRTFLGCAAPTCQNETVVLYDTDGAVPVNAASRA